MVLELGIANSLQQTKILGIFGTESSLKKNYNYISQFC